MKKLISAMLALVMAVSASCFTFVVHAEDTEKRLYIVRLSQPPIYEASDTTQLSLYGTTSSTTSTRARELKIQSEHKAFKTSVSKNTDSNIVYEYNQVFNGMAVEATAAEIEAIKNMSGVTGVYESKSYAVDEPEAATSEPEAVYDLGDNINADTLRDEMNSLSENSGDGEGTVIAIVDSEFDINHEAFTLTDNSNIKITKKSLSSLLSGLSIGDLTTNQVYQNEKIPFVYNYVNKNKDVTDYDSAYIHGTHVSGIAAGNSDTLKGVAPNAQLVLMKITDDYGNFLETAILAAVNDAIKLKADAINLSLGASYANCSDDSPYMEAMRNVAASPTECFVAAGNDGIGLDFMNKAHTSEVEYDTGGTPGGSSDVVTVGNAYGNNVSYTCDVINLYTEDKELYGYCVYYDNVFVNFGDAFKADKYEVVDVGLGEESDYEDVDVEGKLVIAQDGGELSTTDKLSLMVEHGAVGAIYVTEDGTINAVLDSEFPIAGVAMEDYESLKDAKYIQASEEPMMIYYPQEMDTSSSYCINEYLNGGTQLSARGYDVMSSLPNDRYGSLSGTSMATPMSVGAYALVKSYIRSKYTDINSDTVDFKTLCVNMMQNTADIIYNPDTDENVPYTPRVQGAGYINLDSLTKSDVVLTNKDSGKGMVYCGATEDNSVSFTLCLQNLSDKAVTYSDISGIAIRDYVDEDDYICYSSVKEESTFDMAASVTVPAYGSVEFPVTVSLSEETRAKLDNIFKNGFFLEGFVSFSGDDVQTISIPFTSFIGDYFKAPVFDGSVLENENYYKGSDVVYFKGEYDSDDRIIAQKSSDTDRIVVSTNSKENMYLEDDYSLAISCFQLRGTTKNHVILRNSEDEVIYRTGIADISKYMPFNFELTDALSDVAEGEYSVTLDGVLNADKSGNTIDTMSFDLYLDNTAPVLENADYDEDNGIVTVTASDNYDLLCAEARTSDGTSVVAQFTSSDDTNTATLDVGALEDEFELYVFDRAYNYATTKVDDTVQPPVKVTNVSELYNGNIFRKTIMLTNNTDTYMYVTPILAIYGSDGSLLKAVSYGSVYLVDKKECEFKVNLTGSKFPDYVIPDGARLQLYLWDSLDTMQPIEYTLIGG
jgi:lactocepin